MTPEKAIKFLNDAADYFDKLTLATDEDRSYWAYVTNASGCRQIADLIQLSALTYGRDRATVENVIRERYLTK